MEKNFYYVTGITGDISTKYGVFVGNAVFIGTAADTTDYTPTLPSGVTIPANAEPVKLLNDVVVAPTTTAGATTTVAATTTVFDPCAGKTVGQACDGTTALYAGTYGGYTYMVVPSDSPSATWTPAVASCNTLNSGGYASGWFLPTYTEMTTLLVPSKNLIGGFTTSGGWPVTWYWSSTERNPFASIVGFATGDSANQEANK